MYKLELIHFLSQNSFLANYFIWCLLWLNRWAFLLIGSFFLYKILFLLLSHLNVRNFFILEPDLDIRSNRSKIGLPKKKRKNSSTLSRFLRLLLTEDRNLSRLHCFACTTCYLFDFFILSDLFCRVRSIKINNNNLTFI